MSERTPVAAIVVAAGAGRRLGGVGPPKQFRDLAGEPILLRSLRPFLEHPSIHRVVVVLPTEAVRSPPRWLESLPSYIVEGGAERTDSVRNGLAALDTETKTVLIHDGARPFASRALIDTVLEAVMAGGLDAAVIPGMTLTDTIKEVDELGMVTRTVARDRLWQVQTPQAFPVELLRQAHRRAAIEGLIASDDAALFERFGLPVRMVAGDPDNIKVTTSTDLAVAHVLAHRSRVS